MLGCHVLPLRIPVPDMPWQDLGVGAALIGGGAQEMRFGKGVGGIGRVDVCLWVGVRVGVVDLLGKRWVFLDQGIEQSENGGRE